MSEEMITKEDLHEFRMQLLLDIQRMLGSLKQEKPQQWVKSTQIRKMIPISPATLQSLRVSGDLHPKKVKGSWYYDLAEIKACFSNGLK